MALRLVCVLALSLTATTAWAEGKPKTETNCTDRVDNDGDGLEDCGDADCVNTPACLPDGKPENTNARCSDWIDNDGDGHVDCNDKDCHSGVATICKGSWKGKVKNRRGKRSKSDDGELPALKKGQTVEDLIGKYGDKDGERNDVLCSDGFDNDGDGRVDCADFGCRFDPNVTVCRGNLGMRFSIVGSVALEYDFLESKFDTRFSKLQLRSFGPMPFIQDSFYLVSMRAEKTPRLTFAMFQVPLGKGHFININSGGGGLSNALVLSAAKRLMLDPPYYMYSAFEQGNGAAAEVSGPIDSGGVAKYRAYLAGGSGLFAGNVGGRYFSFDNTNFTWGTGLALELNLKGYYSRWDSQFLYSSVPLTIAAHVGAKYDQRSQERYVAFNTGFIFKWNRFSFVAENYTKREFAFGSWQTAYNVQLGVLVWPRHLILGADFGQFLPGEMDSPPENFETEMRRQRKETMWRVALHWYFWRNVGIASLMYRDRKLGPIPGKDEDEEERELRLEVQYRF